MFPTSQWSRSFLVYGLSFSWEFLLVPYSTWRPAILSERSSACVVLTLWVRRSCGSFLGLCLQCGFYATGLVVPRLSVRTWGLRRVFRCCFLPICWVPSCRDRVSLLGRRRTVPFSPWFCAIFLLSVLLLLWRQFLSFCLLP